VLRPSQGEARSNKQEGCLRSAGKEGNKQHRILQQLEGKEQELP